MGDEGKRELHKKICVDLLVSTLTVLLVLLCGPKLLQFFMPLLIAWIIASIANPMVGFLEDKIKIMRKHGSAIVIIFVLLLVGGLLFLIVKVTAQQVFSLLKDLPEIYTQAVTDLQESLENLHKTFKFIPGDFQEVLNKASSKFNDIVPSFLNSLSDSAFSTVGSVASSVIDGFVLTILTLMLSYFFVTKREWIKNEVRQLIPTGVKNFWDMAMDACFRALAGYLKACFKIMIVVFIILWIIFGLILHVKYSSLLALLTAFLDFLPFLGTGIIITPWAIYCIITGEYLKAVILAIAYIICLLAHRLLEPKLVGDSVGMSPFATLISMFIGYRLIGMLGLILGIPVGMILIAFKEKGMFDKFINGVKILANDINEYRKY
ncbi:sporulation integral membrane protein YtvI [bacterium D16-51]|nr:sporulation integral membrane protein YtvI [bacterium D16-59]RKI60268.1 sporulation integral membrane protein YtvI [bacterium D16-51]